jgi:hypothetical protein
MKKRKPATIHLGREAPAGPNAILARLGLIIRTISALQAEADYLIDKINQGLIDEGSLTPKDLGWIRQLHERGEHRAAAEYFRGRMASE